MAAERERVLSEGGGARLLGEQDPKGRWAGGLDSPKWTSTTYILLLLRQIGLPAGNARALAACARLLDRADWYGRGLSHARRVRQPETCITSLVVGIAAAFPRRRSSSVERAVGWLVDQQFLDRGIGTSGGGRAGRRASPPPPSTVAPRRSGGTGRGRPTLATPA